MSLDFRNVPGIKYKYTNSDKVSDLFTNVKLNSYRIKKMKPIRFSKLLRKMAINSRREVLLAKEN